MNSVEKNFIDKGIVQPGGWYIISKNDAIAFVDECRKESITILGIDAFYLRGEGKIQPSLDNSIDFSISTFDKSKNVYDEALSLIKEKEESMYFEIVCEEH